MSQHLHRDRARETDGADGADDGESSSDDSAEGGEADGGEPTRADASTADAKRSVVMYSCVGEWITRTDLRDGRLHVSRAASCEEESSAGAIGDEHGHGEAVLF